MFRTAAKLWPFMQRYRWTILGVFVSGFLVALLTNVISGFLGLLVLCFQKKTVLDSDPSRFGVRLVEIITEKAR